MKSFVKNILFAYRRFKLSAILNLLGLSVAFTVFMIIMMQMYYDRTYNSTIPDADNIYLLSYNQDGNYRIWISASEFDNIRKMSAHIKEASFISPHQQETLAKINNNYVTLKTMEVDTTFLRIIDCRMIAGSINSITEKNTVIIPESVARKYFQSIDVTGKRLADDMELTIGGVYEDFPENSTAKNAIYSNIDFEKWLKRSNEVNFAGLFRIENPSAIAELKTRLDSIAANDAREWKSWDSKIYDFTPVSKLHFVKNIPVSGLAEKVNPDTEIILISVALAILIIAFINFTNFAVALAPIRIKDVNTRKVFGATTKSLRCLLTAESTVISVCSFIISLLLLWLLSMTSIANLSTAGISFTGYLPVIIATALISLVLGAAAGIYPAIRLTSYSPAVALKGNLGLSPKGLALRNALIWIQLFASSVLIISAVFITKQRNFLIHTDYGFDKDELVLFGTNKGVSDNLEAVTNELKQLPEVESVAYSRFKLGSNVGMSWGRNLGGDEMVWFYSIPVSPGFLETLGIKLLEGRDFLPNDSNAIIFNRTAQKQNSRYIKVGAEVFGTQIIGICDDFNFTSLWTKASEPMALNCIKGWDNTSVGYVRVKKGANMFDTMDGIRKIIRKYEPEYPNEVSFYDQILENTYQKESQLTKQITLFSSLAVLISVMGVFGLVLFDSEYRKREIAVRKVFGATTRGIIAMFNAKYMKILLTGFIVSIPVAWYFTDKWMQNFIYRTDMSWWVYALSFIGLSAVIIATVTYQCYRIAASNPVESLKYE